MVHSSKHASEDVDPFVTTTIQSIHVGGPTVVTHRRGHDLQLSLLAMMVEFILFVIK